MSHILWVPVVLKSADNSLLIFCNINKENALHTLLRKKYISFENKLSLIRVFLDLNINFNKMDIFQTTPFDLLHPSLKRILEEEKII